MSNHLIEIGGVSFRAASSANSGFWLTFKEHGWENFTFGLLKEHLSPGSVFLDIGCWEGPFTLYAASLGAVVHAIDADNRAITQLRENIKLNPHLINNIHIHNIALTDEDKPVNLYERRNFGDSASSLLMRSRDSGNFAGVQGKTFNTFIRESNITKIDFIKMDIEGGEFIILPGMKGSLKQLGHPPLLIAFHSVYLKESYINRYTILRKLSKLNGKLSIALGRLFAGKYAGEKIADVLNDLSEYKTRIAEEKHKQLIKNIQHDSLVFFKK